MSNMYGGLDSYNQFINYRKIWNAAKGKWDKKPCDIGGQNYYAETDTTFNHLDPVNHMSRDEALLAAELLGPDYGVGFVFLPSDPFFFLDIDGAFRDGQWSELSRQLRALFPGAYVEASLSNTGLHIVGSYTGDIEHKCKNIPLNIELYTEGRFMALGTAYHGDVSTESTAGLLSLVEQYFNPTTTKTDNGELIEWTDKPEPGCRPIPNDDALIQKAMLSASASQVFGGNTATFAQLWNADVEALSACYPADNGENGFDASSADAALATHLIFWTGGDCERVSRLMRKSSLVRDKWDRRGDDYLKRTILGSKRARGSSDYYRMTDEIVEVIEPCDTAVQLAEDIKKAIELSINSELLKASDQKPWVLTVYPEAIDQIITRTFWSGAKSKLFVLSDDGALNIYREQDMIRLCQKHFGAMWEQSELDYAIAMLRELTIIDSTTAEREFMKRINAIGINLITDHLKMYNQRERLDVRVDMFANRPRVEWHPDKVTVVYTWSPLIYNVTHNNPSVVEDYAQHFPELDDVLQFIVSSRFASNRKHFYTWLQCPSDWGKGFFTGILRKLGILVELSVSECEKAFEGAPLGRDASEFTRSFIVLFDEFKAIKSELKQLENEIPITPKNQLKQSVEIFTKLFTSAEGVESLAGENGVEDQFANRFSYIDGRGQINQRPLFMEIGGSVYADAVTAHIAHRVNEIIDQYLSMGERDATIEADRRGREFHERRNIDQKFERISSNIPTMVTDFKEWVIEKYAPRAGVTSHLLFENGYYYLKSSSKVVGEWIEETASKSERYTLTKKKNDIINTMSDDGRGVQPYRVNNKVVKSVRFQL